jgi:hypothetical protein
MCYNLCYKPTLQAIGDSVNKNHATVIHSIKTFENNLKFDPITRDMYDTIKKLHKYYEGEDVAIPELLKSNELLRNKLAELEESIEQNNIKVVSDYEEISLLNNLLDKLDDDERFLLICKLDALYKLNKNKIK